MINRMDWHTLYNEFVKNFVYVILANIQNYQDSLRGIPVDPEISIPKKAVSGTASAIPYIGRLISKALTYIFKRIDRVQEKKNANKSIIMIHLYEADSDNFIKLLTEAAFEVFFAYSQQFSSVTAEGGRLVAMQNLGLDAGERFVSYVKDHKIEEKITIDDVTKGVVLGKQQRKRYVIVETGKIIGTTNFFEDIGVCLTRNGAPKCLVNKSCSAHRYLGCRRLFPWENVTQVELIYNIEERPCQYKCGIELETKKMCVENAYEFAVRNTSSDGNLQLSIKSSLEKQQQEISSNTEKLTNIEKTIVDVSEINKETMKQNQYSFQEIIERNRRQRFLYRRRVRSAIYRHPYAHGIPVF